jgi:hypothetical protein
LKPIVQAINFITGPCRGAAGGLLAFVLLPIGVSQATAPVVVHPPVVDPAFFSTSISVLASGYTDDGPDSQVYTQSFNSWGYWPFAVRAIDSFHTDPSTTVNGALSVVGQVVSTGIDPGVSVDVGVVAPPILDSGGGSFASISTQMDYFFYVIDKNDYSLVAPVKVVFNDTVKLSIAGGVAADGVFEDDNSAYARFAVYNGNESFNGMATNQLSAGLAGQDKFYLSGGGQFPAYPNNVVSSYDDNVYYLETNTQYRVEMTAGVYSEIYGNPGGGGILYSASVDPIFTLGPGVDPSQYTFLFSPGIVNSMPGTPELPTWAMMIVASGFLWSADGLRRTLLRGNSVKKLAS